jgi:hypothetical protein
MTDPLESFAKKPVVKNRTPPLPANISLSSFPKEGRPAVAAATSTRSYQINTLVEPAYGHLYEQLRLHYSQIERRKLRGSDILERAIAALRREAGI